MSFSSDLLHTKVDPIRGKPRGNESKAETIAREVLEESEDVLDFAAELADVDQPGNVLFVRLVGSGAMDLLYSATRLFAQNHRCAPRPGRILNNETDGLVWLEVVVTDQGAFERFDVPAGCPELASQTRDLQNELRGTVLSALPSVFVERQAPCAVHRTTFRAVSAPTRNDWRMTPLPFDLTDYDSEHLWGKRRAKLDSYPQDAGKVRDTLLRRWATDPSLREKYPNQDDWKRKFETSLFNV